MGASLNREALEAPLVNMSFPRGVVVSLVTHRVRRGDPSHEPVQFPIGIGTPDKMPMIWHPLVTKERDNVSLESFRKDSLKCGKILRLVEILFTPITSIQGVV